MAKAIYKNKEDVKNAKEKLSVLKFEQMKSGKVSVNIENKRRSKKCKKDPSERTLKLSI